MMPVEVALAALIPLHRIERSSMSDTPLEWNSLPMTFVTSADRGRRGLNLLGPMVQNC
jgi:hypothetical protein